MRKLCCFLVLAIAGGAVSLPAQEAPAAAAAAKTNRTIGEVTNISANSITVKLDAGGTASLVLDPKTTFLRVPPGEQDLKKATKIQLSDVGAGDRVLIRNKTGDDQKQGPATSVIVMTKSDLAQKQAAEHADWQRRGVGGTITAIDPATKQITVSIKSGDGVQALTIEPSEKAIYRRYAPDSVRFADAKPSSFSELAVGNSVRVLGDKTDDTHMKPEIIVSGSFHNVAGTIVSVDTASGEIKMTNLETKKPMIVKVNPDSNLRRVPPQMAMLMANMQNARAGGAAAGGPAGRTGGAAASMGQGGPAAGMAPGAAPGMAQGGRRVPDPGERPARTGPPQGGPNSAGSFGGPGGPGGPGGGRGMSRDFSQMLDRMPLVQLSELKAGDAIIVATTAGADPGRVTAITLLAGVEPILTAPRQDNRAVGGSWNFDINIVP